MQIKPLLVSCNIFTLFAHLDFVLISRLHKLLKLCMQTFNEFFIRELKPGARPIACMERDDVAVCAADSRLMAFKSANDSLRFWIKVLPALSIGIFPMKISKDHLMLLVLTFGNRYFSLNLKVDDLEY